jgi:hypothetical protein
MMDNNQDLPSTNDDEEIGSDELLSGDNLRLPESANILVRLHALRAWLARRHHEATIAVGEAALHLQQVMQEDIQETGVRRLHRRMHKAETGQQLQRAQQTLAAAQQRLRAYEEAQSILEDYVAHTSGERVLVEYYLALEELLLQNQVHPGEHSPWSDTLADILRRIEHVGIAIEE